MKLRNHPLMSCVGLRNWPPAWLWRNGSEDTRPAGEVGFLRHVILSDIDPPKRCFLVMEHMGAEYIGCLSFENSAFCSEIDITYAPNTHQLTGDKCLSKE